MIIYPQPCASRKWLCRLKERYSTFRHKKGSAMNFQSSGQGVRKSRRFALVAALALMMGFFSAPLPASASSNTEVEASVVLIGTTWSGYIYVPDYASADGVGYWTDQLSASSFCTGWFASTEGDIVTAGHCVDPDEGRIAILTSYLGSQDAMDSLSDAIVNWTVEGDNDGDDVKRVVQVVQPSDVEGAIITNNPITAQIVDFRGFEEGDLALLRVAGIKSTPPLTVATTHPTNGDALTAVGFPGSVAEVMDGTRVHASFKSGTASSRQFSAEGGVPTTEINADISPGMSGGPTVNAKGEVLGVNSFTLTNEQRNFNFITDTDDLETFLKTNDIGFVAAPVDNGSGTTIVVVIAIVVLLLLLAGAYYILVWRKKHPATAGAYGGASVVLSTSAVHENVPEPAVTASPTVVQEKAPIVIGPAETTPLVDTPPEVDAPPTGVFCPECGTHYPGGTKFCSKDGTALPNV